MRDTRRMALSTAGPSAKASPSCKMLLVSEFKPSLGGGVPGKGSSSKFESPSPPALGECGSLSRHHRRIIEILFIYITHTEKI